MTDYKRQIALLAEDTGCDRAGAPIVRGVSFALEPGGAIQLFGANGSGKTSLLALFAGHIRPAAGGVIWRAGDEKQRQPFDESIFFLGHESSVKPALTAEENLLFWATLYGIGKAERKDHIRAALARVGMSNFRKMRAGQLSAGQRRRIDLARAILAQREVWLLDEPAAAIDAEGAAMLRGLISEHLLRGGVAVVATHDEFGVASRKLEIGG